MFGISTLLSKFGLGSTNATSDAVTTSDQKLRDTFSDGDATLPSIVRPEPIAETVSEEALIRMGWLTGTFDPKHFPGRRLVFAVDPDTRFIMDIDDKGEMHCTEQQAEWKNVVRQ